MMTPTLAETKKVILKIVNEDTNGNPLNGFVYDVTDQQGNTYTFDLTKTNVAELEIPLGKYTIKEVKTLKGYEKYKNVELEIDYSQGKVFVFKPKHIKSGNIPPTIPNEYAQTSSGSSKMLKIAIGVVVLGLFMVGMASLSKYTKKTIDEIHKEMENINNTKEKDTN